jgi:hypothetical protein
LPFRERPQGGQNETDNQVCSRNLYRATRFADAGVSSTGLQEDNALYTILQILSLTLFEKIPLDQLLNDTALENFDGGNATQLNLFS